MHFNCVEVERGGGVLWLLLHNDYKIDIIFLKGFYLMKKCPYLMNYYI